MLPVTARCGTVLVRHSARLQALWVHWRYHSDDKRKVCVDSIGEGIRKLTLNDVSRRNALSLSMLNELHSELEDVKISEDINVVILAANGKVFSSGHDLRELTSEMGGDYHTQVFRRCSEVMLLLQQMPIPIVAQVQGLATAAGCQLVATCDIVIAADTAKFATPGIRNGLFCSTPAVAVARALPRKVAAEMLYTGEPISAQTAHVHGLVSRVVPGEKLEEETLSVAKKVNAGSSQAIRLGKRALAKQLQMADVAQAYEFTSQVMVDNLQLDDAREGITAFLEKRRAVWQHDN